MEFTGNKKDTLFFEQWFECFNDPLLLLDESGCVLLSNKGAEVLFQQALKRNSKPDFKEAIFNDYPKMEWQDIWQVISLQKSYHFYCAFQTMSTKSVSLEINTSRISIHDSDFYVLHVIQIKEIVEQIDLLDCESEILSQLLKNTNEAYFFVDGFTKKIIDCNDRAIELFEFSSKEKIIGLNGTGFHYYPMSAEMSQEYIEQISLPKGWTGDVLYKSHKGRRFWGRINAFKFHIQDSQLILVRITDIDKEKKALEKIISNEKKYRDLIKYNQALICTHDLNGVILSINPASSEALQLNENEIIGKNLRMLFDKKRVSEYELYLKKINEEDRISGVMEVHTKYGEKRYWLYSNYKVHEEGEEPYVVGSARDITERMIIEQELVHAKSQAISSLKARELFLANVSHEIRTPMNGIIGIMELLNKTTLDDTQSKYTDIIKQSSERLLIIINDILEYAKIESGTIHIEHIPFNISDVTRSIIQPLLLKGNDKQIDIHVNFDSSNTLVMGDPYRYGQVISNLVNNAIKFTTKGSVFVKGEIVSENEMYITYEISIKDTGIGIAQEDLNKIFDEFTQAHISHARKYGGTGLGLSICKRLIEMQGGTLRVISEPNVGSEFIITCCFTKALLKEQEGNIEKCIVDRDAIRGINLLLAEDNEVNQFIVKSIADFNEINIDIAENGIQVINMIQQKNYDLILMDIQMPEMDGIEATRYIRNVLLNFIPIIAFTANAMNGDLEKYIANGMDDYLSKPFKEEELLNKIGKVMDLPFIKTDMENEYIDSKNEAESLYSTSYLKTIGNNNPEFVVSMLKAFAQSIPGELVKLQAALDIKDLPQIKLVVHKMKSSAKTLLIKSIEQDIHFIEKFPEPELNEQFYTAIESVRTVLKQVIELVGKEVG